MVISIFPFKSRSSSLCKHIINHVRMIATGCRFQVSLADVLAVYCFIMNYAGIFQTLKMKLNNRFSSKRHAKSLPLSFEFRNKGL